MAPSTKTPIKHVKLPACLLNTKILGTIAVTNVILPVPHAAVLPPTLATVVIPHFIYLPTQQEGIAYPAVHLSAIF